MRSCTTRRIGVTSLATAVAGLQLGAAALGQFQGVANANPKITGVAQPNVLTLELTEAVVAQGSMAFENGTADFPRYGYSGDAVTLVPLAGAIQSPGSNVEATKTEPDKNTYLVLAGLQGADPTYNYGSRFLFQGHENGAKDPATGLVKGCLTRVNLDADGAHRVTLLATTDVNGKFLPAIDGSTWHPWSARLLLTAELGTGGGVWQATPDYPSVVEDLSGSFGRGGYEAVQADNNGALWVIEDVGGSKGVVNSHARQPNSFVYRFVPKKKTDLSLGGKLQVLQVISLANPGQPIVFHAGQADADILSQDVKDLHTYGLVFTTHFVTIHDTATDGFAPFDANALAKAKSGTPFKRPENGQFRPGSRFRQFYFDETGDTDANTEAGSQYGGFGSVLAWTKSPASDNDGTLTLLYRGDVAHTGLDNCSFWDANHIVFGEDCGDTLHTQRNALDSAYLLDVNADYSNPATPAPIRLLALGRDASSTIDSSYLAAGNGFQNDGDNEITGIHVSDGDATIFGVLGMKIPSPFTKGWRAFYTQQHGDNVTFELLPSGL